MRYLRKTTDETVLEREIYSYNVCIRKEGSQISNLSYYLKKLDKD